MERRVKVGAFMFVLFLSGVLCSYAAGISAYGLKCEHLESPVGIDAEHPRFSWICHSDKRGFKQTAYRLLVASSPDKLKKGKADMWDSGWKSSSRSILVPYGGKALQPGEKYYWTVRIKGTGGTMSEYSRPAIFITGLYTERDWHGAEWIALEPDAEKIVPLLDEPTARGKISGKNVGPYKMPQFRRFFTVKDRKIRIATAHVSGLGHFDFFLNGKKVGDHFLDPGWTDYSKEAQYVTFDVTSLLKDGSNVVGVMLGNGFYNVPNERYYKITGSFGAPVMRMVLKVEYADGGTDYVVSDSSWKVTESPVTYSSIYGGEDYDAGRRAEGWMLPGFDDSGWREPVVNRDKTLSMYSCPGTELKVLYELPVCSVTMSPQGYPVYDFGQNFSGIVRMKLKGKAGQTVLLRPGELLADSTVVQWGSGAPFYYRYTVGQTGGEETWQPQFTYYGQRYVQIEGAVPAGVANPDSLPEIMELTGLHTTGALRESGTFSCSNPLFNKIFLLVDWAIRSNVASVLTDCPHREKLGWQEQSHLMQHSLQYRYDMAAIYPKILRDLKAAQWDNGCVPTIAPEYVRFSHGFGDTPEWGSTAIISPWYYYKWYGDDSLLRRYYPAMQKYAEYLGSKADDNIVAYGLGDWYDIGPNPPGYAQLTSNGLTATAIYYTDIDILKNAAALLGKKDDEEKYLRLADEIKEAYNRRFYDESRRCYDRGSQTANAISYVTGLAEGEHAEAALASLVADIADRGYALTAGDVGYRYVLAALTRANKPEVVFRMNSRYDTPGYGWQLAHGATALTESWQAYPNASNNHFMLGHILEWFYSALVGIRQTDGSVGFKTVEIDPMPCGDITSASGTLKAPYGDIVCGWEITGGVYRLKVSVPANSDAVVWLPTADAGRITEHGVSLGAADGIKAVETVGERTKVTAGSGTYLFAVERGI
ncbi:MAG: glycoside hydrolase family 78 protein [Paraprevotella sp.]|nr:glycoside hydrolase family 78 protein [Paraprevotella sp.]